MIMRELFNTSIIGSKESGIDRAFGAVERAHKKYPELFTVALSQISEASLQRTTRAIERIGAILQEWLDSSGDFPIQPKQSSADAPGAGKLPYWNTPLKYPERDANGQVDLKTLSEIEVKQFLFADKIREIAVELLRAEQWIF